jgi:hypothetical protein
MLVDALGDAYSYNANHITTSLLVPAMAKVEVPVAETVVALADWGDTKAQTTRREPGMVTVATPPLRATTP